MNYLWRMRFRFIWLLIFILVSASSGCVRMFIAHKTRIPWSVPPPAPDYSRPEAWAALPSKADPADRVPEGSDLRNLQAEARADVFFIHPTSYLRHTGKSEGWNADWTDESINAKTDAGSILNQASAFNNTGRIYAPRYRQAYLYTYVTPDTGLKWRVLDTAYADVRRAFEYYLAHYHEGRPIIIASHSQGTTHAIRLVRDFFDGESRLREKLVAAYLVGMDVYDSSFTVIKPCRDAYDNRCFVSWRAFASDFKAGGTYLKKSAGAVCTNPLTWKTDTVYAPAELNRGGVTGKFSAVVPNLCDARVSEGVLEVNRAGIRDGTYRKMKNYHVADYNLFYLNIRDNAADRLRLFTDIRGGR
jgi:hypothetical protein